MTGILGCQGNEGRRDVGESVLRVGVLSRTRLLADELGRQYS